MYNETDNVGLKTPDLWLARSGYGAEIGDWTACCILTIEDWGLGFGVWGIGADENHQHQNASPVHVLLQCMM